MWDKIKKINSNTAKPLDVLIEEVKSVANSASNLANSANNYAYNSAVVAGQIKAKIDISPAINNFTRVFEVQLTSSVNTAFSVSGTSGIIRGLMFKFDSSTNADVVLSHVRIVVDNNPVTFLYEKTDVWYKMVGVLEFRNSLIIQGNISSGDSTVLRCKGIVQTAS